MEPLRDGRGSVQHKITVAAGNMAILMLSYITMCWSL